MFLIAISKQLSPNEMYIIDIMKLIELICKEFSFSEKIVKKILADKVLEYLEVKNSKFVS